MTVGHHPNDHSFANANIGALNRNDISFIPPGGARHFSGVSGLPIHVQPGDRPVLALDIDETLVHVPRNLVQRGHRVNSIADVLRKQEAHQYQGNPSFIVSCASGDLIAFERPFVRAFLSKLAHKYTLIVYTAGDAEYAGGVVQHLDPSGTLIAGWLSRGDLSPVSWVGKPCGLTTAKDLTRVCSDLCRVLLVDDTPANFHPQPSNGIRVRAWHGDCKDKQLRHLAHFLSSYSDAADLRQLVSHWRWEIE